MVFSIYGHWVIYGIPGDHTRRSRNTGVGVSGGRAERDSETETETETKKGKGINRPIPLLNLIFIQTGFSTGHFNSWV